MQGQVLAGRVIDLVAGEFLAEDDFLTARAGAAVDLPRRRAVDRREERAVDEDAAVDGRVPRDVWDATVAADDPGDGRLG